MKTPVYNFIAGGAKPSFGMTPTKTRRADMGTKREVMKLKQSRSFDWITKLKPKLSLFDITKLKLKSKPKL